MVLNIVPVYVNTVDAMHFVRSVFDLIIKEKSVTSYIFTVFPLHCICISVPTVVFVNVHLCKCAHEPMYVPLIASDNSYRLKESLLINTVCCHLGITSD